MGGFDNVSEEIFVAFVIVMCYCDSMINTG